MGDITKKPIKSNTSNSAQPKANKTFVNAAGGGDFVPQATNKTGPGTQSIPQQFKYDPYSKLNEPYVAESTRTPYTNAPVIFKGSGKKDLKSLSKDIDQIGVKGDTKTGSFVEASINVDVPIPEVPGLSIFVGLEGKYMRYAGGNQKLSLKESLGVKYSFFDIFEVSAEQFVYLNLEGKSLGDAYVDALKQTVFFILRNSGINKKFAALANWNDLPLGQKMSDLALDHLKYGPISPLIILPKLMSTTASKDEIEKAYQAFIKFFKNNEAVGFEVGIGGKASAEVEIDESSGKVSAEAIAGIEDVDKKKATGFTEIAFSGKGKVEGNEISFRLSKRWRGDGSKLVKLELEGEFQGDMGLKTETVTNLKNFIHSAACAGALNTVLLSDQKGKGSVDIEGLRNVAALAIPMKKSTKKIGIGLSFSNEISKEKSTWKAEAVIRAMQAFKEDAKGAGFGIEMELKYGTFIEVSAEIESYLKSLYPNGLGGKKSATPVKR